MRCCNVGIALSVAVAVGRDVGVWVAVSVRVSVALAVGLLVSVWEGAAVVGWTMTSGDVFVSVATGVSLLVGVCVAVSVTEGVAVDVFDGIRVEAAARLSCVCNAAIAVTDVAVSEREERCVTSVNKIAPSKTAITPPVPTMA